MAHTDRRFAAVVAAYSVSSFGTYLNLIALSLFSYEVTGTALGVGLMMALRLSAGFAAGMTSAALTARVARAHVMYGAHLAQCLTLLVLALFAGNAAPALLAVAVVVLGASSTWFSVSLRSSVPAMVGAELRGRANGLLVTARSIATVLGFASAAVIIGFGGYALAFAVNAASFALAAAVLLAARPRTEEEPDGADHGAVESGRSAADGQPAADGEPDAEGRTRAGLRRLGSTLPAVLLALVALRGLDALASSSHNVALPVVAHSEAPDNPALHMTRFWVAWAVGTVLAHLVLRRRRGESAWGVRAFALGTCAMSAAFVAAFLGLPAIGLVLVATAAGFADGWTEIVYTSRLQAAPEPERTRLFGLSATAEQSGFALGTVAAAGALEALPALAVVGLFHGTAACGALLLLLYAVRRHTPERPSPEADRGSDERGAHGARARAGPVSGP
ncbi:MFS transporter [Streptomyces sp. XM4193]|uniref:MFS transporter n=1 Tax=Streptomyces sp. XM4193 TaxID=2929782 RepID=UPI001FF7CA55|nr:MFS transporter [Streptomyces sp. XM4193]MCK1798011.1 MFS transporter [Streptomyces sp. XM4193]